jgi:hypothetical protein
LAAATLEATYTFGDNLNAEQSGVAALTPTDPLGQNAFTTDTVFGSSRTVYAFNGSASPATQQAGLTFNDGSNLISPTSYSVQLVFEFAGASGWRRILDVQNRQSDDGLYVSPNSVLSLYPSASGTTTFSAGTYYDVILTNTGTTVTGYLNGKQEFSIADSQMNVNNPNNPNQLIDLFLDNTAASGIGEFSSGKIALFEAFNGVLSSTDAATLAASPFANTATNSTPEPATWILLSSGIAFLAWRHRRRLANVS